MGRAVSAARPLVTVLGASGYIGSAVAAAFARRPVRLRAVARRPATVTLDGAADVEVCTADLTSPRRLAAAVEGSDLVIHLVAHTAGPAGWRAPDSDPDGTRLATGLLHDLVAALRSERRGAGPVPAVVFASTAVAAEPSTPYERHKRAAERALAAATAGGAVRGVALRLPTVFGPGPAGCGTGVVTTMVRRALAGDELTMWHDGTVRRDLLSVDDAARAFVSAARHADALAGGQWAVGGGRSVAVGAIFRTIAVLVSDHTGKPAVPVRTVPPPAWATAADLRDVAVDPTPFRSVSGWRPRTPHHDALIRTVVALAARGEQA